MNAVEVTKLIRAVFSRARDIVAAGWTQGDYSDGEGRWCLVGAIQKASRELGDNDTLTDQYLYSKHKVQYGRSPVQWNDHPDRTQAEVVAALDLYARTAELSEPIVVARPRRSFDA